MEREQKKNNGFSGLADRAVSDEELDKVTGGDSKKCDGCEYSSNGACRSYGTMGTQCPHGFA